MYTVITENDESQWDDITGERYHFPAKYLDLLHPGTSIIYYKGRIKDQQYKSSRLLLSPHYFGIGIIGKVTPKGKKDGYYAEIIGYKSFGKAVPFKLDGSYLETIPLNKSSNYWRDGVRPIDKDTYNFILSVAHMASLELPISNEGNVDLTTIEEGEQKRIYTTIYERKKQVRKKVIELHGLNCMCCNINFKDHYGDHGDGYIHVHHLKPISSTGKTKVNPLLDFAVVCANCHSMIHRKRGKLLSVEDVRNIILESKT